MKVIVSDEFQTTPERAWALYFDQEFNRALRENLRVESINELEFQETPDQLRMVYKIVARRTLPEWVRKVVGDVKVGYTSYDVYDKNKHQLEVKMVSDVMPSKIKGGGIWTIKTSRPGYCIRRFEGDIRIELPLVGGQMEQKLAAAIEGDFKDTNGVMHQYVQRDLEALAAGKPLPELTPPQSLRV